MPYADPVAQKKYVKDYMRRYPPRKRLATWLKCRYKMSLERYDQMVKEQGNRCAICRERPAGRLSVDHDHVTGNIRGLLCRKCNAAIGALGDSVFGLQRALNYLEGAGDGK